MPVSILFCHARNYLSGIHVFVFPGFPPEDCGNDFLSVMPEITCRASMFLLFLDSRQKIAGMTEGALDPRLRGNDFLSVMPEIACRASMFLFFLDSRQKIAGMTDGARDSRLREE